MLLTNRTNAFKSVCITNSRSQRKGYKIFIKVGQARIKAGRTKSTSTDVRSESPIFSVRSES